ncbi:MAG: hypothetical protein CSB13_01630 [Chloroflexi bacterium]|nr:MAG: hypothetical protein CSB13_01630 [Chloroflexota bacterium]
MKLIWKLWSLLVVIAILMGQLLSVRPVSAQDDGGTAVTPDPRFGAIESFWTPEEAAELGVGWDRILFYWNQIQPTGADDWNTLHVLEEWLHEANAQNRTVLGVLKNTPEWAWSPESEGSAAAVPAGLYLPINDPDNLWAAYTRKVAEYYAPLGVHHWIIWNEPDIAPDVYGHEFAGSMRDYYQLLKVAYKSIKAVDAEATIHLGGMTYWHDPGYLRDFLNLVLEDPGAAENDYYFDVITLHIYFRPESVPHIVGNAFNAQVEAGINPPKEVWVNETNARPSMDPEWPVEVAWFPVDLEQQAWYAVQATALGFAAGASHVGIYKLVDVNIGSGEESWGLIRPHDFSKRPAFYAYQATIKYLSGFEFPVRRQQFSDYFVVKFKKPDSAVRVLWARHEEAVTAKIPAMAETAVLADYLGNETVIEPEDGFYILDLAGAVCYEECFMGGAPLFLIEEGVGDERIPDAPASIGTPTITPTPSVLVTPTVSVISLPTEVPTATETAVPTDIPEPSPTATAAATPSPTATAAVTPSPTATMIPSFTPVVLAEAVTPEFDTSVSAANDDAPADRNQSTYLIGTLGLLGVVFVGAWWWRNGRS